MFLLEQRADVSAQNKVYIQLLRLPYLPPQLALGLIMVLIHTVYPAQWFTSVIPSRGPLCPHTKSVPQGM